MLRVYTDPLSLHHSTRGWLKRCHYAPFSHTIKLSRRKMRGTFSRTHGEWQTQDKPSLADHVTAVRKAWHPQAGERRFFKDKCTCSQERQTLPHAHLRYVLCSLLGKEEVRACGARRKHFQRGGKVLASAAHMLKLERYRD
uniref:Uncharacterized protein n=1 Tax=Pipistrellus kuhlii TaxID=59472 RepID=A0A7J7UTI4_PIPKU|nr:hypothetical protein mPipKuh1_008699 [Pipistrellus kuhlii]